MNPKDFNGLKTFPFMRFRFYAVWLSLLCIGVFILQMIIGGFTDVFVLNEQSFFQPWRFLTSIFLHADILHLMFNLFALLLFGSILEKIIGGKKFLLLFFVSGIFANLMAVNFYSSSLGASGAVYGILGCLAILRPKMAVWVYGMPMPMFIAAILWIAAGIFGLFVPSNIGHIAHLSGIGVGFIFGIYLRTRKKKPSIEFETKFKIPETYMRDWEDTYIR